MHGLTRLARRGRKPGLSLCIVLGPLVIVSSFLLCLVYVLWANRVFDPALRDLDR
jgi:uncharacterized membrane protein (DUF485 family)